VSVCVAIYDNNGYASRRNVRPLGGIPSCLRSRRRLVRVEYRPLTIWPANTVVLAGARYSSAVARPHGRRSRGLPVAPACPGDRTRASRRYQTILLYETEGRRQTHPSRVPTDTTRASAASAMVSAQGTALTQGARSARRYANASSRVLKASGTRPPTSGVAGGLGRSPWR
jgi:hypothetical protein